MENQEKLDKEIGTKEVDKLKPAKVKIEKVEVKPVGAKAVEKLVCYCSHPGQDEPIKVSAVEYEKDKQIKTTGLWYTEDADGLIQKGSPLALFLEFVGVKKIRDLKDVEIMTVEDGRGYLCFKAH